jgi:hypothetical protein
LRTAWPGADDPELVFTGERNVACQALQLVPGAGIEPIETPAEKRDVRHGPQRDHRNVRTTWIGHNLSVNNSQRVTP